MTKFKLNYVLSYEFFKKICLFPHRYRVLYIKSITENCQGMQIVDTQCIHKFRKVFKNSLYACMDIGEGHFEQYVDYLKLFLIT